jgi:hypothetical protein
VWVIYTDRVKDLQGIHNGKMFLDLDNFEKGLTFAWNIFRSKATKFNTKLEAETAAIQFSAKHPEWMLKLRTTWTKVRI